jgi:Zn finger protein HypA/HybF involved in hydrogenase expression
MKRGKYRCDNCGHRMWAQKDGVKCYNCKEDEFQTYETISQYS